VFTGAFGIFGIAAVGGRGMDLYRSERANDEQSAVGWWLQAEQPVLWVW